MCILVFLYKQCCGRSKITISKRSTCFRPSKRMRLDSYFSCQEQYNFSSVIDIVCSFHGVVAQKVAKMFQIAAINSKLLHNVGICIPNGQMHGINQKFIF